MVLGVLGAAVAAPGRAGAALRTWMLPKGAEKRAPRAPPDLFTEGGKALVGVAPGGDPDRGVEEAVALIGGLDRLALAGKTVLVKPNVVSGRGPPTTTSPAVVGAVVRRLYRAGARKVYVGDMSAMLTLSTRRNMEGTGLRRAAEDAGAEVVAFEDSGWVEVPVPGARHLDRVYVTEWVYRVDRIVNLPVVKTHRSASYSICLKNFVGCTHLKQRPYLVDSAHWEEVVAELNLAYRPDLNVVDATVSMIEGGPWKGAAAATNLIVASGDRVAADAFGVGLIRSFGRWEPVGKKPVWEQRQLRRALELGLGRPRRGIALRVGRGEGGFAALVERARAQAELEAG
ncbi:MAG: DUF362 domain-containing protein [Deferrisomatales bacterium]